jgi:hypothetical protein
VYELHPVRRIPNTTVRISEVHTIYNIIHRSPIAVKKTDYIFRTLEGDRTCDTTLIIQPVDTYTRTPPVEYRAINRVSQISPKEPTKIDHTGKQNILLAG